MSDINARVSELEVRMTDAEHRIVGVDGTNGLTSSVRKLTELVGEISVPKLKEWGEDVWHKQRPETCIGKDLLAVYKNEHEKTHLTDVDMRKLALDAEKARRDSSTTLTVALIGVVSSVLVPILMKVLK